MIYHPILHLQQDLNVVDRLLQILSATLGPMAAQVLDGASLHVRNLVLEDELNRLNRQALVVVSADLGVQ